MMATATPRPRGRMFLLSGLGIAAMGIAGFVLQMGLGRLRVPWYMPIAAIMGAALIAASLRQGRTAWRVAALVLVVVLAGFEMFALSAMSLPRYDGPIAVGKPFPAFAAKSADGSPFTQASLEDGQHTAMVFFRGRW